MGFVRYCPALEEILVSSRLGSKQRLQAADPFGLRSSWQALSFGGVPMGSLDINVKNQRINPLALLMICPSFLGRTVVLGGINDKKTAVG